MQLGGFRLLTMIAQGGMGTVWLARPMNGAPYYVALKSILPAHGENERFFQMFLDEARLASRIQHENVVRVLEWGEDGGCLFIAMEYLEGDSLRKLARGLAKADPRAPFPMAVALRLAAETCAGLHAAHELCDEEGRPLDVVHRDVSPQNVIVGLDGHAKLIDFGVAKARYRLASETTAGTLKGKVEYMAPEQVKGGVVDRRADVYAVGAMTYELLAGHPVHQYGEDQQIRALHALITGAPHAPLPDHVPPAVRAVIECALSREPSARFASAAEMRVALEQAMAQAGITAPAPAIGGLVEQALGDRIRKRKKAADDASMALSDGRVPPPMSVSALHATPGPSPGHSGAGASGPGAVGGADASGGFGAIAGSYSGTATPVSAPGAWPRPPTAAPPSYGGTGGTDAAMMVAPPVRSGSGARWVVAALLVLGVIVGVGAAGGALFWIKRPHAVPPAVAGPSDVPPPLSAAAPAAPPSTSEPHASAPTTGVVSSPSAAPSASSSASAKPPRPVVPQPSQGSGKPRPKPLDPNPSPKGEDYGF